MTNRKTRMMKYIFSILLVALYSNTSFALTGGDDIASAVPVTTASFVAEITASNTANTMTSTCFSATFPDVYYSFTADATSVDVSYVASSITGGIDPRVQFLTFDGTNYVEIECHTYIIPFPTANLTGLTVGETVYMRFVDNGGDENGTVEFNLTGTVLPLDLISFKGEASTNENILTWRSAQAINVDFAEIQRSSNGQDFESIDYVPLINGSNNRSYIYTDERPINRAYYRLKIVDYDGTYAFSEILIIDRTMHSAEIKVFPNPTADYIYTEGLQRDERAEVYTANGLLIGYVSNNEPLNISNMSSGVYLVKTLNEILQVIKL